MMRVVLSRLPLHLDSEVGRTSWLRRFVLDHCASQAMSGLNMGRGGF